MADDATVKQLLLQVDATTELLRRNLDKAQAELSRFQQGAQRTLDATDKGFANLGRGLDQIAPAVQRTNTRLGTIGATAKRIELQVEASSSAIAAALSRTSGVLATAFSVQKVAQFADAYTRFTNQLKVAGLEGQNLAETQQHLYDIAQRYGVQLESVGTLYGRAKLASDALGASQADILRFTNGVAAALKVQGGAPEETAGALLQLSQLLGEGTVHAQEFNSVLNGARPILQAVANGIDKYKGSISALRADVLAQKVTSQEFFQGFLRGSSQLETQARQANLTIGASLTILGNALSANIGKLNDNIDGTERFSQAVQALSSHLDVILPALTSIAIGYGTVKVAGLGLDAVSGILGKLADADAAVARQVLLGNAQFIDRTAQAARAALAVEAEATAEVAAIEATIAARAAEQAALKESIAQEQALITSKRAEAAFAANSNVTGSVGRTAALKAQTKAENDASFAAQRLADMRARQVIVDGELAVAETELTVATSRATAASEAATVATTAATFSARAAATASALFAGALDLVAGALPILAIAALVGAIIHFRNEAAEAEAETKAFNDRHKEARQVLAETAIFANSAASGIAQVGNNAAVATGKVAAFAGKVGEAAQRLYELAIQQRNTELGKLQVVGNEAATTIRDAQRRIDSRAPPKQDDSSIGRFGAYHRSAADIAADAKDQQAIATAQADLREAKQQYQAILKRPLQDNLPASALTGGVDVPGELARLRNDLKIATAGGDKAEINSLKAQVYQLTQYQAYRKQGLSDETARSKSADDAERLRTAGQGKIDAQAGAAGQRASDKADRQHAAEVRDQANDTRAYKAAERQAEDAIAQSNAELTNSAAARAQIERDRVEADRVSKNEEIAEQGKAGRYTAERVKHLQDLNDQAAKAATDVINQKERRQQEQDAADLATHQIDIQRDMLGDQAQLATTADQRRAIELHLLDLEKQEEKIRLDRILAADSGATESERKQAQIDSDTLDARYASKSAVAVAQNLSPGKQFVHDLNAEGINDQLEKVKVDGLQSLESGITDVITGTKSLSAAFKDMAQEIIAQLVRIALEQAIIKPIATAIFGGLADGGPIPGFASGGSPGGLISGPGTGTSDSILAVLSDNRGAIRVSAGEYIMNERATQANLPELEAMNAGKSRRFATGGAITPRAIYQPAVPDMKAVGASRARLQLDANVTVEASPLLDARMQNISIQTVGASAEPIMAGAQNRTIKKLNRPSLPGGTGW